MNQAELEARLAAIAPNGDVSRLEFSESTVQRKVTKPGPTPYSPPTEETASVPVRTWIDRGTGVTLRVVVNQDGTYEKDFDGVDPKNRGEAATKPEDQQPGPKEGDTRGPQTGPTREVFEGGKWVPKPNPVYQAPTPNPAIVATNTTEPFIVINDGRGNITTTKNPNYAGPKPEKGTTLTVKGGDGKTYLIPIDAQGNPGQARDSGVPGDPDKNAFGVEPEGAPPATHALGQVTSGLRTYSQWLSGQVKLHKDTNGAQGVAPAEATKLMERRIALAEGAIKEQQALESSQSGLLTNATTQRGQSLNETQNRRGVAERLATEINARGDERLKYLAPGDAAAHIAARQEQMQNALAYATQWGGLRESPEVNPDSFPALAQARRASLESIQTAAAGGPQIFNAQAIQQPPSVAPQPNAQPAAAMAEAQRQQATASAPIVPPANNPIDGSPIVLPTQLPRAAPPISEQARDTDYRAPGGAPTAGEPGGPPLAPGPVWMPPNPTQAAPFQDEQVAVPPPIPSDQYQPPQPYNTDPSAGPVGMLPARFMQETRYGPGNFFDPDLAGDELSMRLGIDPEIMRQAKAGLYG